MKLYRSGGLLLLVATLCQFAQTFNYLGFFSGIPPRGGFSYLFLGTFVRVWEDGYTFRFSDLFSLAYIGGAMVILLACSLAVIRGKRLWAAAKLFIFFELLFLFSEHLHFGVMMESFFRVSPRVYTGWYLFEAIFYLLFISLTLIVLGSPEGDGFTQPAWRWLFFSVQGRISRSRFWQYYVLGLGVFAGYCYMITVFALGPNGQWGLLGLPESLILSAHINAFALWPMIALLAKRCHDRNYSGWFQLLLLVPLVNIWCWINLLFLRGTEGPNRFDLNGGATAEAGLAGSAQSGSCGGQPEVAELTIEDDPDSPQSLPGAGSLVVYQVGGYLLALGIILDIGVTLFNQPRFDDLWVMALPAVALLLSFVLAIRAACCKALSWWGLAILTLAAGYRFGGHLVVWARFGELFFDHPDYAGQMAVQESIFLLAMCGAGLILGNFSAARMADLPGKTDRLRWLLFSSQGRISRSQFFWGQILVTLVAGVFFLLLAFMLSPPDLSGAFASVVLLLHLMFLSFWPMVALATKRCHDRDKSGWYQLLNLIPLVNIYYTIEMLFFRGSEGANHYGKVP